MSSRSEQLVTQLKALGDPVRLRIVALCGQGECSVSELTDVLSLSQPRVSQHLKQLCDADVLERFRDGHFVYYRVAGGGQNAALRRKLIALIPADDEVFTDDTHALQTIRSVQVGQSAEHTGSSRALHRALVALTVATPLGDFVDIGCGRGRILKLLGSRAHRAVGVDIDPRARRLARAELQVAGLPNCTLRQGDMYRLPFADGEFDTAILDDVLIDAADPVRVIGEAVRILQPGGRLLLLAAASGREVNDRAARLANWCLQAGLRVAPARAIPSAEPEWVLAVATKHDAANAAA